MFCLANLELFFNIELNQFIVEANAKMLWSKNQILERLTGSNPSELSVDMTAYYVWLKELCSVSCWLLRINLEVLLQPWFTHY